MMTNKGIFCDAEVGKIGAWRACNRRATVTVEITIDGRTLDYCDRCIKTRKYRHVTRDREQIRADFDGWKRMMQWAGVKP